MKSTFILVLLISMSVAGAMAEEQIRVFITDSESWSMSGGFGISDDIGGGGSSGGARPQTVEIMKTFDHREECDGIIVTRFQEKADFVVLLDHEGGKNLIRRDNKVAVFNKEGDLIFSGSTRSLGNAVRDACQSIRGRD